ncbi:MAG: phosphoserine phosphatase SerB [Limnobacter sp.]|nr:phosphoserine phosphatase SerB [Limnobacter sp.]
MTTLCLSAKPLETETVRKALDYLSLPTLGVEVRDDVFYFDLPPELGLSKTIIDQRLTPLATTEQFDFALLEPEFTAEQFKLLAMDMDSTLITIECIDEIADYAGKKKEVSEITEAAMRGEIKDFAESLNRRVALLKGVPESVLDSVYKERLRFSPGATELLEFAKANDWKTLLVSGGFTFFTQRLQHELGLDFVKANTLEVVDGQLTGHVLGDIVDGEMKKQTVLQTCEQLGIKPEQCITMGDGANDLPMMGVSGVSVAFKAKPKVQAQTDFKINTGGLDTLVKWLSR